MVARSAKMHYNLLPSQYLHSIRQTCERKVANLHRRQQIVNVTFNTYCSLRFTEFFQVVKHDDWTFVKAEILDWKFDHTIFNVESTVACQPRQEQRLWINASDVPQACNKNSFPCAFDKFIKGFCSSFHDECIGLRNCLHAFFLCPVS